MVVLRLYRVKVKPNGVGDWETFERAEGVPMVRSMDGCIAAGFGRIKEQEGYYLFFSLWRTLDDLETARVSPTWRRVVAKMEDMKVTSDDSAEHVILKHIGGIAIPK